jgi:hypothetical protein
MLMRHRLSAEIKSKASHSSCYKGIFSKLIDYDFIAWWAQVFQIESCYIAQAGLEFIIFRPQPPKLLGLQS